MTPGTPTEECEMSTRVIAEQRLDAPLDAVTEAYIADVHCRRPRALVALRRHIRELIAQAKEEGHENAVRGSND